MGKALRAHIVGSMGTAQAWSCEMGGGLASFLLSSLCQTGNLPGRLGRVQKFAI
jgi:hypothetical protein